VKSRHAATWPKTGKNPTNGTISTMAHVGLSQIFIGRKLTMMSMRARRSRAGSGGRTF
jgi:hypothetical protein